MKVPPRTYALAVISALLLFLLPVTGQGANGLSAVSPQNAGNTGDKDTIVSAIRCGDVAFASTKEGLYEGSISEKTWRKLDEPSGMKPGGTFIQQDPASHVIGYYYWELDTGSKVEGSSIVFASRDAGKTWMQTSTGRRLVDLYIHKNGIFYAIEYKTPREEKGRMFLNGEYRVLCSQDLGMTWKDISSNLSPGAYFTHFFRDPEHPDAIGVIGGPHTGFDSGRYQLYEAEDKDYHWVEKGGSNMVSMDYRRHRLEFGSVVGGGEQYQAALKPTLSNYFMPELMEQEPDHVLYQAGMFMAHVPAFQMSLEKTVFTFPKNGSKIIPVKLKFLASQPQVKILDNKDETIFWRVDMVTYGKPPDYSIPPLKRDVNAMKQSAQKNGNSLNVKLDSQHPYERDVDLSRLHDFSKPGIYRIQLCHSDEWLDSSGGQILSPVIDVTITE